MFEGILMKKRIREREGKTSCSSWRPEADIYTGKGARDLILNGMLGKWGNRRDVFAAAAEWGRRHWFVRAVTGLRLGFMNYGLRVTGEKLEAAEEAEVRAHVGDLWRNWLLHRNAASFWRLGSEQLVSLDLQRCEYSDAMGLEVLRYDAGLTVEQRKMLPPELEARFASGPVLLRDPKWNAAHPEMAEDYLVLRDGPRGEGFAWPSLLSAFNALGQSDGMEAGDALLGEASRLLLRLHKKGHEIRSGIKAGQGIYHWSKAWSDALLKELKGKAGLSDFTTNFDHDISYVAPDPKLYDDAKWEGVERRLLWWSGPWGRMLVAKGLSPFLLPLAKTEAEAEREAIGRHVAAVMGKRGRTVELRWSNRCFQDEQIAAKMLQFAVQQGMLDSRTTLEQANFDTDEVRARKREDIRLLDEDERLLWPAYDAAHGPGKGERGRPAGSKDGEKRKVGG